MQMRPEVQIAAMIKAMKDVVIPAVAGSNKLAEEQAKLVVAMLSLMAHQLPLQFRFDRDELARLVQASAALKEVQPKEPPARAATGALIERTAEAEQVLEQCRRDPDDLRRSVHAMRAAICDVVEAFAQSGADGQEKVESIVLAMSAEQLLRDRSLVKLQGWEPDPAAVPDIEKLIG
ncbi:hypothetical protein [Aromatoleum petrolei]|uniref:Uncharacterized protein n=1 Tax=Aromatoleum petrolei TaxID=76116 RepID=A0ABX1MPP6_9RHOO|nr:hypothetical protein [Aromatoleum petrolei]NMF87117.1 hypothetical protein [Aromatoleum petrolei]QTQ34854.1 Uncharacterized protein ToN1_06780 [Aromatoleum petrolei]